MSECAQAADCPVPQTFILFGVQDIAEQDVLCRLELKEYQHFPAAPVCQLCRKGSQPVQISGSSYLAGYAPTEAVALPQKWFERQKSFVQRFGRLPGVLKVHFNDPNEYTPRHHAFYVDVGRLLDSQDVRSELRDLLKSLTPQPDFALLPAHPVSERLSVFLKSDLAIGSLMFQGKLSDLEQHPREALAASKSLLILDDVFITGSRLDSINRQLRESADKLCPQLTNIHFVTVLATSPSEERYHRRKTGLTAVHKWTSNLVHLYQVPLPDWHSANQCPWCKEHAILSEIAKAETLLEGPVVERLSQLGDPKRGVETNPYFIPFASSPLPNLGAQSAVLAADSSPMQVLFACASGLQQLRAATVGPRLAADRYPAPTFLAERVFSNNYTERLIWLALLRGALPVELEPALKSFLRTIAEATARNEEERFLKGEMGLLYLLGSLGPLPETGTMRAMFVDLGIAWETLVRLGYVSAEANVPAGIASASVVAQRAAISKTRKGLRHVLGETLRSAFQKVFG